MILCGGEHWAEIEFDKLYKIIKQMDKFVL